MSRRRLVEVLLLAFVLVGVNVLAARHYRRWDTTRAQVFALSDRTQELVRALDQPVKVLVFLIPRGEDKSLLYPYVRELVERLAALSPKIEIELTDLDRDQQRLQKLAARYGVGREDLEDGVIVIDVGGRSKFLRQSELGTLDYSNPSGPRLKEFTGEQAFVGALLQLTESKPPTLCFTDGHGEADIEGHEIGGAGELGEALARDHYVVRKLANGALPDETCDVVVLLGPADRIDAAFSTALAQHLERGKHLLVSLGPTIDARALRHQPLGIEELLSAWGADLPAAVLVDEPRLPGNVLGFAVTDGYREHPITRSFVGRRTIWADVRPVVAHPRPEITATPLILSTERGWGEISLEFLVGGTAALAYDAGQDLPGPLPLGLALERTGGTGKGARLVVWGAIEQLLNRQLTTVHRDLFLSSLGWLVDSAPRIAVSARAPERFELKLTDRDRYRIFGVAVLGLPIFALLLAAGLAWLRR